MVTIEIYSQQQCEACHVEIPRIIREANALGIEVRTIDIDRCAVDRQDVCLRIEYVPTLMYRGKEISISDLKNISTGSP